MYKIHHYFQEIHARILYLFLSFLITVSISYFFIDELFYIFTNLFFEIEESKLRAFEIEISEDHSNGTNKRDLESVKSLLYQLEVYEKSNQNSSRKFIFTDITEAFRTSLSLAFGFTFYIHLPFIVYHIWSFFIPSLFRKERKIFSHFCSLFLFLYFIATLIIISFIFPVLWNFFLNFETKTEFLDIHCEARISSYVSFIFKTCLMSHFIFQFPFFSLLFLQFEFFNIFDILKNRRWIYWSILLISAVVAPPDVLIQGLISFCLVSILEMSLFFIILFTEYTKNLKTIGKGV